MLEYIIVAIVAIFILKKIFGGKSPPDKPYADLIDSEDTVRQISKETKAITEELDPYADKKQVTVEPTNNRSTLSIDLSCFKNLSDLLKATDIVYSNAELNGKNRMNESRFHYYCRLHFRSHMADQYCRQKKEEIKTEYTNVNNLIVQLKALGVSKDQHDQIIKIKDLMKNTIALLNERSARLASQTGTIRDKIGSECGQRGYEWWLERKKNAENEKQNKK